MSATQHKPATVVTRETEPATLDQILDQVVALTQQQQRPSPIALRSWAEIERFAEKAAKSGMVPQAYKGMPDAIMIAVLLGAELGLAPMQSLQNVAVISNRPAIFGDAMIALVRASGKARSIREWSEGEGDALVCWCEAIRKDDPNPITSSFGVADAKKATLWGKQGPWQQYPARMLKMRARGFCLRDGFADVLKGVISAEEAADIPLEPITMAPRVEPPQQFTTDKGEPRRRTVGEWLDALALELAACEGGEEVDAVLARPDVVAAQDKLGNGAKDRLDGIISEAIARTTAAETTAPTDEVHGGTFANPSDDPFAERVPA